jgi:hypothetical protein
VPKFTTTQIISAIGKATEGMSNIDGFSREDIIDFYQAHFAKERDTEAGPPPLADLLKIDKDIYQEIASFKLSEQQARSAMQYTEYAVKNIVTLLAIANFGNAISDNDALGGTRATVAFSAIQFFINHFAVPIVAVVCEPYIKEADEAEARLYAVKHHVQSLIENHPNYIPPAGANGRGAGAMSGNGVSVNLQPTIPLNISASALLATGVSNENL